MSGHTQFSPPFWQERGLRVMVETVINHSRALLLDKDKNRG